MDAKLLKYTIPAGSTLLDVVEAIKNNKSRCVLVTRGDRVAGVLSEGDIMSATLSGTDMHAPIDDFVRRDFKFLQTKDLVDALGLMRRFGVTLVPIVDHEFGLVDVITLADVLNAMQVSESK